MYLVFTSRKREEPLHVISLGSSGTGKTHLQSGVGELMPVEDEYGNFYGLIPANEKYWIINGVDHMPAT